MKYLKLKCVSLHGDWMYIYTLYIENMILIYVTFNMSLPKVSTLPARGKQN